MAGVKGQAHTVYTRTFRQQMWQTMRIKAREFTLADLLITVPGAAPTNAVKMLTRLKTHGIIREIGEYRGGRPGDRKRYKLVDDAGPRAPQVCTRCGGKITAGKCKKEGEPHAG